MLHETERINEPQKGLLRWWWCWNVNNWKCVKQNKLSSDAANILIRKWWLTTNNSSNIFFSGWVHVQIVSLYFVAVVFVVRNKYQQQRQKELEIALKTTLHWLISGRTNTKNKRAKKSLFHRFSIWNWLYRRNPQI